MTTKAD